MKRRGNGALFYILLALMFVLMAVGEYFIVVKVFPFLKSFVAYDSFKYRAILCAIPVGVSLLVVLPWSLLARLAYKTKR